MCHINLPSTEVRSHEPLALQRRRLNADNTKLALLHVWQISRKIILNFQIQTIYMFPVKPKML